MKHQFKTNNFVAIIIALILFAIGFLLFFIHKQSESTENRGQAKSVTFFKKEIFTAPDVRIKRTDLGHAAQITIQSNLIV